MHININITIIEPYANILPEVIVFYPISFTM